MRSFRKTLSYKGYQAKKCGRKLGKERSDALELAGILMCHRTGLQWRWIRITGCGITTQPVYRRTGDFTDGKEDGERRTVRKKVLDHLLLKELLTESG